MKINDTAGKAMTLVIGGMLGAGVALILAPQAGRKTRREIVKYSKKAGNRTQKFIGDIGDSLDSVIHEILDASSTGIHKGRKLTALTRKEILDVLDAGKKYIDEERTKLEKLLKA